MLTLGTSLLDAKPHCVEEKPEEKRKQNRKNRMWKKIKINILLRTSSDFRVQWKAENAISTSFGVSDQDRNDSNRLICSYNRVIFQKSKQKIKLNVFHENSQRFLYLGNTVDESVSRDTALKWKFDQLNSNKNQVAFYDP